ncbi:MAG: DMT family transporter, partial [Ruminiclostridium sp.]|nr:DMT family transporter [Ruminiclostridium sp.]
MRQNGTVFRGTLCAVLGGVCWGFSGTMGQFLSASKGVETSWIVTVRMIVAGILLLSMVAIRRTGEMTAVWRVKKDAIRLVVFAVVGLVSCQFTYLECIAWSNSATGTALNYLGQMMILFYVCLTTRRMPTRWEITALLLAALGVFFLATHGDVHRLVLSPQALFWGLLGAAMVVVYS